MTRFKTNSAWQATLSAALCLAAVGCVSVAADSVRAQESSPKSEPEMQAAPRPRLITVREGRWIAAVAGQAERAEDEQDCSHLVHTIYVSAGFAYPYASSFEMYAGQANFARVKYPRAGDVIAWRGHVGIVVDARGHQFYSLVRTGAEEQDYESTYWRSRGIPRFYRFRAKSLGPLSAATRTEMTSSKGQERGSEQ